jgi:hypothetical protein
MSSATTVLEVDEQFRAVFREMIYQQHPLNTRESDLGVASDDTQEITQ